MGQRYVVVTRPFWHGCVVKLWHPFIGVLDRLVEWPGREPMLVFIGGDCELWVDLTQIEQIQPH